MILRIPSIIPVIMYLSTINFTKYGIATDIGANIIAKNRHCHNKDLYGFVNCKTRVNNLKSIFRFLSAKKYKLDICTKKHQNHKKVGS